MRRMLGSMFAAALVVLVVAGATIAIAASPVVRASVDKKSVYVGDPIRYSLEADVVPRREVSFPSFTDDRIGDFEIKSQGSETVKPLFGKPRLQRWYSIAAFTTGTVVIPPCEIRWRMRGERSWHTEAIEGIPVQVLTILPKDTRMLDIKDIKAPFAFREFPWLLLGALGVCALIAAAAVAIYRRLRELGQTKLPHEIALADLERLLRVFNESGNAKEYYVGVSDCIRRYIESELGLRATEMTTEEFLASLHSSSVLTETQRRMLQEFLQACDLVKFARYAPQRAEAEGAYDAARRFVNETAAALAQPDEAK